jgi:formylglycine-generating enzyme required for sulfatase activity
MTKGSANFDWVMDGPYYRTQIGAYDLRPCDSAYGTYDQAGNVWEWNEAVIGDSYRGLRGGSFAGEPQYLYAGFRIDYINPAYEFWYIGFRVAHIPQPIPTVSEWGLVVTTLLVLTAGTVVFGRM